LKVDKRLAQSTWLKPIVSLALDSLKSEHLCALGGFGAQNLRACLLPTLG